MRRESFVEKLDHAGRRVGLGVDHLQQCIALRRGEGGDPVARRPQRCESGVEIGWRHFAALVSVAAVPVAAHLGSLSPPVVTPADLQAARVAKLSPPVPTSTPTPSCAQADDLGRPALGDSEQYSADKVVPSNSSWLKRSDKRTDVVRPMGDAFAESEKKSTDARR